MKLSLKPRCTCDGDNTQSQRAIDRLHWLHCDLMYSDNFYPKKKKRFFFFYPLRGT